LGKENSKWLSFLDQISILTAIQHLGEATYKLPPSSFDFDHVPKKAHNTASASLRTAPVHVHIRNDIPLSD
jgi:hypothetical protein